MKIALAGLAVGGAISLSALASAQAQPDSLGAFCTAHPNSLGQGELSAAQLPAALRDDAPMAWRCMDGQVLVCSLGATGGACEHTVPVDAARMRSFRQYCRRNADSEIPNALLHHLASTWRCDGMRPVKEQDYPVDRAGYFRSGWRALR